LKPAPFFGGVIPGCPVLVTVYVACLGRFLEGVVDALYVLFDFSFAVFAYLFRPIQVNTIVAV
jgi:hypothetical protein